MENLTTKHLLNRALLAIYWAFALLDYFVCGGSMLNAILSLINGFIYVAWTKSTFKLKTEGIALSNVKWYKWETGLFLFIVLTNAPIYFMHASEKNVGIYLCFLYALFCSGYYICSLCNRKITTLDKWLLKKIFKVEE